MSTLRNIPLIFGSVCKRIKTIRYERYFMAIFSPWKKKTTSAIKKSRISEEINLPKLLLSMFLFKWSPFADWTKISKNLINQGWHLSKLRFYYVHTYIFQVPLLIDMKKQFRFNAQQQWFHEKKNFYFSINVHLFLCHELW